MQWITQNWIWIVVAIGVFYFMTRMPGMGRSMGSMRRGYGRDSGAPPADRGTGSNTAFDPVSRRAVTTGGSAISAVYHDRAYYFENREDRDAFEAEPEKYIAGSPAAGQPIGSEDAYRERPRRRGGC
jgi:YHS domain-containing protein